MCARVRGLYIVICIYLLDIFSSVRHIYEYGTVVFGVDSICNIQSCKKILPVQFRHNQHMFWKPTPKLMANEKGSFSLARCFTYGIGWWSCFAIRLRQGISTYILRTQSLMLIFTVTSSSGTVGSLEGSNIRPLLAHTSRTSGLSFHSLQTNSTSQVGSMEPSLPLKGMVAEAGHQVSNGAKRLQLMWRSKRMGGSKEIQWKTENSEICNGYNQMIDLYEYMLRVGNLQVL